MNNMLTFSLSPLLLVAFLRASPQTQATLRFATLSLRGDASCIRAQTSCMTSNLVQLGLK